MRIPVVALGLVLLLPALARADGYEETEYRLKTAGVGEDLRERIHEGIRRGVAYLRRLQAKNGTIAHDAGHTALAGLALRHAAIPDGVEGGRAAIRWLARHGRKDATNRTYEAGITAMLLMADRSEEKWNRQIHDLLAKGPQKAGGYWDYKSQGGSGPPNLSTAQFGALGLWAGERAGAPVARKAWRLHLEAVLEGQTDDGSWSYAPPRRGLAVHSGSYPTGTFMGLANLTLARQAIHEEIADDPDLLTRVLLADGAGRAALRRHVAWELEAYSLPVFANAFPLYRTYAMEKVCIFLDVEEVGGRRWYMEGAERLLAAQSRSGGWTSSLFPADLGNMPTYGFGLGVDTAFALLFLLRASQSYHPITPRPVDRGPVITPGDDPMPTTAQGGPPITAIAEANALLDEVEGWLARSALDTPRRAADAFTAILRIWPEYRPDGVPRSEAHDAWCRNAQDLLMRAATRFVNTRAGGRSIWQAVALQALDALAATDRHVAPQLMRAVERMERSAAFRDRYAWAWYSAAMDTLRRLEAPALSVWLTERCLSDDVKEAARTSAALITLGGIRGLKGLQRHAAAKAIVTRLVKLFRRSGGDARTRDLQIDLVVAVHRLANAHADTFPPIQGGTIEALLDALEGWWRAHGNRSDPAWSD